MSDDLAALDARVTRMEESADTQEMQPALYTVDANNIVKSALAARESGVAVLEGERPPEASDYSAPGARSFEGLRGEYIVKDSIGALAEGEGTITLGGLFNGTTMPFTVIGPGIHEVNFAAFPPLGTTFLPTTQERIAGKLWSAESPLGIQLYQLKGKPGTEPTLTAVAKVGETKGVDFATYNSAGASIVSGAGFSPPAIKLGPFPADGIMYLVISHASHESGAYPGLVSFSTTVENLNENPFESPGFSLPEGFIYNIAAVFTFATREAAGACGLMVVEIATELEPPSTPEAFGGGCPFYCGAAAPQTFAPVCAAFASLYIPEKQSALATGGVSVKATDGSGAATDYAWEKQKVVIQQLEV